jgi:hypothetical protein
VAGPPREAVSEYKRLLDKLKLILTALVEILHNTRCRASKPDTDQGSGKYLLSRAGQAKCAERFLTVFS